MRGRKFPQGTVKNRNKDAFKQQKRNEDGALQLYISLSYD